MKNRQISPKQDTSWEPVHEWYINAVGQKGDYYHEHCLVPDCLKLLHLKPNDSVLDLACGQGILERSLPPAIYYQGLDLAPSLIDYAHRQTKEPNHFFAVGDITKPLPIAKRNFDYVTLILALQNIEKPELVFENAFRHLELKGKLLIVLNHPCFRIPRQSRWGVDEAQKIEYRRIDRYLSPLKIPIRSEPSQKEKSPLTWSFHHPLSDYSQLLRNRGFVIETIEEWTSDKTSRGSAAKMENRAREEFPLFLALLARKD